jgi:hypothetical protein
MTARVTKITDGTTTVDFESTTSGYVILRHRLATAQRDETSPELWTRVDEVLEISVEGSTQTELAQRLERLTQLIEQARRLMRGENVTPVIFQYRIDDSALADPLQSLIVGPAESGDVLTLPESFDNYTQLKAGDAGDPVVWRFRRRGALLGDEETRSRTNGTVNNPGVMTPSSNFTDTLTLPGPYKLSVTYDALGGPPSSNIMVLTARSSGRLVLVQGESGIGTNFASAVDADASGGNVGRYTPADVNTNTIAFGVTIDSDIRKLFLVLHLKNRSTTISYNIRAHAQNGNYGRIRIIGVDNNDPQLIPLGLVISPFQAISQIEIEITASGIGDASHSLDIDTIAVVAAETTSNVLAVKKVAGTLTSPIIDHALLTWARPIVMDSSTAGLAYSGAAHLFNSGNTAAALVLGGTADSWLLRDDEDALLAVGATWARRPAYLIPR